MRKLLMVISVMVSYLFAGVYVDPISALPIPRALAQGNTYTAVAGDIYSGYFNPAGLANIKETQFSAISTTTMMDVSLFNLSAAINKSFGTFFVGYSSLGVGSIKEMAFIAGEVAQVGSITNSNYALSFGYGNRFFDSLDLGVVFNSFTTSLDSSSNLYDYSASALALNFGLKYDFRDNLFLGLSFKNLSGAAMEYSDTYSDEVASSITFGVLYLKEFKGRDYKLFLDIENQANGFKATMTSFGLTTDLNSNLEVRGGLRGVPKSVNGQISQELKFTFGFGLDWQGLMADYAYYPGYGEDENKHYISVSILLGNEKEPNSDSVTEQMEKEARYEY